MKLHVMSLLRRVLKNEQGQSLALIAVGMVGFVGVSGLSMDLINAYAARQTLQASTNAAALSGAVYIWDASTTKAVAAVHKYSSEPGSLNATPILTNVVVPTPTFSCLSTVTAWGTACVDVGNKTYTNGYNAMTVTQTADVQTWFAKLFGIPVFHLTATAYASPGSAPQPLNLAVIVDSTGSMGTNVTGAAAINDPQCKNKSQMLCALNGVGILLNSLPVPSEAPVALFTFPNVTANTVSKDLTCGTATGTMNSTPILGDPVPTGAASTYLIVPFTSDYSSIIKAVGVVDPASDKTTTNGCLKTPSSPGGNSMGTYLAGAIVAAQSALTVQQGIHPVALGQNIMVILTDGNVNGSDQYGKIGGVSTMAPPVPAAPTWDGNAAGDKVNYPSGVAGCGQAVQVAQAARASALKTSIFVVAYGAPTAGSWNPGKVAIKSSNVYDMWVAGSCPDDQDQFFKDFVNTKYGTLLTNKNVSFMPNISPCTTAQDIATPDKAATATSNAIIYFYSDNQGGGAGTCPSAFPPGSLSQIFKTIAGSVPRPPRLIPAGTT